MGCDKPPRWAASPTSRHLDIGHSCCSPTAFTHRSPCLFLWYCSSPWDFFTGSSWDTRYPELLPCLPALPLAEGMKAPPCPPLFQALSTESSGISGAHLGRCAWSSHAPTYNTVFAATVIMPLLTALHSFKQRPPCWGIPNWLLMQS